MVSTVDRGELYDYLACAARFAYGPVSPKAAGGVDSLPNDELDDWHAVISWILGTLCTYTEEQLHAIGLPVAYIDNPTTTTVDGFEISNTVLPRMENGLGRRAF